MAPIYDIHGAPPGVGVTPNGTIWTCEQTTKFQRSKGIFFGDNPLTFTLPVLILQTSLVGLLTTFLKFLLTPLGQSSFLPYVLAGLIMGPSVLGQFESINKWLFPPKSFYVNLKLLNSEIGQIAISAATVSGLVSAFELVGEHFLVGPIILGMAVPDGPPLGSALAERMDTLVSIVFLPLYFLFSGGRFKLFLLDTPGFLIVQVVAIFSFCGKVIGTMLPSIYFKMPVIDALSLGATTPIVKFLYDPSKSYLSLNRRRTIEHAPPNVELRLMACIHSQDNTPSIINVLEMSNPTQESPICFYVLHLVQLKGRSSPLFIDHQPTNKTNNPSYSSHSQHIINAFRSYEQQNLGHVLVKLYTSISPYETMHDEICMQLAEKRASMLIVPFHRQWIPNKITESAHRIRALNRHLLRTAPCSVGVLVERGTLSRNNPLTCVSFYSVGMIFIEGSDDREALAFAMRMANHPNVRVTVIRLMEPRMKSKNLMGRDPDGDMIHKFMVDYIQVKRHDYREEIVRDSVEMINVVRSLEGCYDLILVGRRHASESLLFSGLKEWNEYPELGTVGDMLVASDSTFDGSVLVVQQQKSLEIGVGHHDLHLDHAINYAKQEPSTIVEMPRYTKMRNI
ncbi:Sodium/solute symporter superfamily [Sesbania bispinosa]|nr:Sodium/solute symporter superfamily [Sesbania bispinosa]